ncbi:MAG: protein kinase [Candidatus Lindowbacteria bacterium]|nr:protein kinase [Candidatus Lindowbacteria bacterium]
MIDIVWPATAILVSYGACACYQHVKTERERASLRKAFSHYVPPSVLARIVEEPGRLKLGGERVNLSILVLVLEQFERFSDNAEPEEIVDLLNSIYEISCETILKHGGTIDKFTKDGLIAYFGAPIKQEEHAQLAAKAALSIRREMADLSVSRNQSGQKMIGAKMAINTGFATVGNMGSSKRMEYTVVGRTVNLCVRMANAAVEGQILATRKTCQELASLIDAEECGEIRLDPFSKPFFILNLMGLKAPSDSVPAPVRPAAHMEGKRFLGPFTLIEKLGAGSTGAVYKARDESLDRQVAIKVLFPGLRKDRISAITDEARVLAKLNHPNIVQVYSAGQEDEIGFLAMEFVEGFSLREILNSEGCLPIEDALDVMIQVSRGLNAAYKQGIVHRDVKPANVLVNTHNIAKVTDFGLADTVIHHRKAGQRVAGTLHYISPEQSQGLKTDCRSDIYSLGITFFHLLTGDLPFRADNAAALVLLHTESELPIQPLREKEVPESVIKLICKMTSKKPGDRPENYLELLKEFDKVEREIAG